MSDPRRDRRQRVLASALNSTDLTYREKLFMVVVSTIAPEYVEGRRRHGSKAMAPDGTFALHLDYLARALATSAGNVKKLRRACQEKQHLMTVHEGTFGRPSTWQALVVRGDKTCGVTYRQIVPPYGSETPATRGDTTGPLVYRTPDQGDHAPEPGGREPAPIGTEAPRRTSQDGSTWHPFEASEPITSQRETA